MRGKGGKGEERRRIGMEERKKRRGRGQRIGRGERRRRKGRIEQKKRGV